MIKDFFESSSEFLKTRLTNPFLGTLVAVWIVRNFEFLYIIFNFQDGVTLVQKVEYIRAYFGQFNMWARCTNNILITIALLVSGFIVLLFTRFLTNCYAKLLIAVNKYTDKGATIARLDYDDLMEQFQTVKKDRDQLKTEATLHDKAINEHRNLYGRLVEEKFTVEQQLSEATTALTAEQIKLADKLGEILQLTDENASLKSQLENLPEVHGDREAIINFNIGSEHKYGNYPAWLRINENIATINKNFHDFLKSPVLLEFNKTQKAIIKKFSTETVLETLFYLNLFKNDRFGGFHVEVSDIKYLMDAGTIIYYDTDIRGGEIKLSEIKLLAPGLSFFNGLTNNINKNIL